MSTEKCQSTKHNSRCLAKSLDDEPIFVLRAHDATAPEIVAMWAAKNLGLGTQSEDKIMGAMKIAQEMKAYGENMFEPALMEPRWEESASPSGSGQTSTYIMDVDYINSAANRIRVLTKNTNIKLVWTDRRKEGAQASSHGVHLYQLNTDGTVTSIVEMIDLQTPRECWIALSVIENLFSNLPNSSNPLNGAIATEAQ